jgi:hypothetical protein
VSARPAALEQARLRAGRARDAALLRRRRRDADDRPLPDFVILGAQKAGTSSLYARLAAHPQVVPALRKEVHWFDDPRADADPDARHYRAFFPTAVERARAGAADGRPARTGEATPYYLVHPGAPSRAARAAPDTKLVVVLRDPVARAVSGYHHAVRFGHEQRPIEVALDPRFEESTGAPGDTEWWDDPRSPARVRGYLTRGRYAEQLARWWEHFPRERTLVLETPSLRGDEGITRVCELLDLGGPPPARPPDRNVASYPPPPDALVARLRDHFAPVDAQLAALLGSRPGWV